MINVSPVRFVEGTPCAVVSDDWLENLWNYAVAHGYRDPLCTQAGQDAGFMPHDHIEVSEVTQVFSNFLKGL